MNHLQLHIETYFEYYGTQKRLDGKSLKAYRIDPQQYSEQISLTETAEVTSTIPETYVTELHQ